MDDWKTYCRFYRDVFSHSSRHTLYLETRVQVGKVREMGRERWSIYEIILGSRRFERFPRHVSSSLSLSASLSSFLFPDPD